MKPRPLSLKFSMMLRSLILPLDEDYGSQFSPIINDTFSLLWKFEVLLTQGQQLHLIDVGSGYVTSLGQRTVGTGFSASFCQDLKGRCVSAPSSCSLLLPWGNIQPFQPGPLKEDLRSRPEPSWATLNSTWPPWLHTHVGIYTGASKSLTNKLFTSWLSNFT